MVKDLKDRLVVQIASIPEQGLEISEDLPREWLTNIPEFSDDSGAHLEGLIRTSGVLRKEGENLRLRARVSANLVTICTRCGAAIHYPLRGEFELTLIHGSRPPVEGEVELTPEDLVGTYYLGEEVDLAPFFQEEVAVQVPIQPLCKPDCAGLCPHCGANLNLESCECKTEEADSRLAVLRNLKICE